MSRSREAQRPAGIVFLDVDGVLNRSPWSTAGRHEPLDVLCRDGVVRRGRVPADRDCVDRLNEITCATESAVVVASSWRQFAAWDHLALLLAAAGVEAPVVGETPDLPAEAMATGRAVHLDLLTRGHEVAAWLADHPGVERYVVLDDVDDYRAPEHVELRARLVLVDPRRGLDEDTARAALRALVR